MTDLSIRPRRLRQDTKTRNRVRETRLSADQLILPVFVKEGRGGPVPSMPGVSQLSIKEAVQEAVKAKKLGIFAVLLFGIPLKKDEKATGAYDPQGIVQTAIRAIKDKVPDLTVITDVCLCEYMSHGHCGVVKAGKILNDPSLEILSATALSHAEAGADVVAPSDMMDGRVKVIRKSLDHFGFSVDAVVDKIHARLVA